MTAQRAATQSGDPRAVQRETQSLAALALEEMANLRLLEGAPAQAVELYRQSLQLENTPDTRVNLAVALARTKHRLEADAEVEQALSADPKNARAWQLKGSEEMAREDYATAVQSLSRSLDLHTDVNGLYALGFSLLRIHQPEKAKVVFSHILELYGDKAIWHVIFGGAYRDSDYPDLAIEEFKHAIAMDPRVGHAHFFLGLTYLQDNRWAANQQSLEQFHEAIRLEPRDYLVNFYLGAIESTAKEFESSDKHLRVAAEVEPNSPEAWLYLGLNAFERHDNANAQRYLERAIQMNAGDLARNDYQIRRAYFVLGRIYVMEGRREEGEKLLSEVRAMQQKSLANSAESINSFMKKEGMDAAPAVMSPVQQRVAADAIADAQGPERPNPAAELDPSTLANSKLSSVQLEEIKKREQQLRQVLADAYNDWGTAEARQQQYGPALAHFQEAEHWDADTPGLMRNVGIAAFRMGDFAESARALGIALQRESGDQRSRMMLAMSLFSLGKFDEAAKSFALAPTAAMQDPRAAYAWAFSLSRINQPQQANRIVDTLIAQPLQADVLALVCHVYTDTENYEYAASCFRKAYAEDPSLKKAHYEVAAALIHLDRPAEAIPELQEELKVSPGDPNVQYYLAYALLETSHKDEAAALLRTVVATQPNHPEAQYQLGKLLLEQGETQEAIKHLEVAEQVDPSPDYVHYQLQTAYRRAGRTADADRELKLYRAIKEKHREIAPQHAMQSPR